MNGNWTPTWSDSDLDEFEDGSEHSTSDPTSSYTEGDNFESRQASRLDPVEDPLWLFNRSVRHETFEEFFITYGKHSTLTHWIVIKCHYQNVSARSLEADLMSLNSPEARAIRLYRSLAPLLPSIKFEKYCTYLDLQAISVTSPLENHSNRTPRDIVRNNERSSSCASTSMTEPILRRRHIQQSSTSKGSLYLRDEERRKRQWANRQPIVIPS